MIDRIVKNEERFDRVLSSVKDLQISLDIFLKVQKDLTLLSRYYGSKNWLKDKELYENNSIKEIKAGVLSEDGVWNMLSNIDEIILDMKRIIEKYENDR